MLQQSSKPLKLTHAQERVAQQSNLFGFQLLNTTATQTETAKNICLSPLSVSIAFGAALNGANGETRSEIERVLQLAGKTPEEINETYQALLAQLPKADPKVQLNIANALWYDKSFGPSIRPEFLVTNKTYFGSRVEGLDFRSPSALTAINDWVKGATQNKIGKILERIEPSEVLFLMNALYFKGQWQYEFKKNATQQDTFYPETGSNLQVSMMQQTTSLAYSRNDLYEAVELPYGDGVYVMNIFLPREGKTAREVLTDLTTSWPSNLHQFKSQKLSLFLPRWKNTFDINLNEVLQAMGIKRAFSRNSADFSNITPDLLWISKVIHKTFIEVNEEGTEAAAATSIGFTRDSANIVPQMVVNRPFVYLIREKSSGTIVFSGIVHDPNGQ